VVVRRIYYIDNLYIVLLISKVRKAHLKKYLNLICGSDFFNTINPGDFIRDGSPRDGSPRDGSPRDGSHRDAITFHPWYAP
jgi:hypothetical protein